jgi:hypothetical protein
MIAYTDYNRLSFLGERLQTGQASKVEIDEYMRLMLQGKHITEQQYADYMSNRNRAEIVNAALSIGAIVLIGYVVKELLTQK